MPLTRSGSGHRKPENYSGSVLSLIRSILLSLILVQILFPLEASAQIVGTFFPTIVGEIQEGYTPFPSEVGTDLPWFQDQAYRFEEDISKRHRPYFRLISAYANQSLLQAAGQMDTFSPSTPQLGFWANPQTEVRMTYVPTIFGLFGLRKPRTMGEEFRLTVMNQPTDRLKLVGQLGLYQWARTKTISGGLDVLGAVQASYQLTDRIRLISGFRRDILGGPLMGAAGLNLAESGLLVGRLKQNLFFAIGDYKISPRQFVSGTVSGGTVTGSRVQTNPFLNLTASYSRLLYRGHGDSLLASVSGSYTYIFSAYKYTQNQLGNAIIQVQPPDSLNTRLAILRSSALGETALTPEGERLVGPYFSPSQIHINSFNIGANGKLFGTAYWRGNVGLGPGTSASNIGPRANKIGIINFGGGANAAITYRLGHQSVHEQGWYFLQAGFGYRRQVFYSQSKYYLW